MGWAVSSLADCVGMRKEELVTSTLLIDLDALEKNIQMISEYYKGTKNAGIILTRRATGCR